MSDGRYETGEWVRITSEGLAPTRVDFYDAWEKLEDAQLVDAVGGAQYIRVRDVWLAAGRPTPIREWILIWADALPAPE